MAEAAKIAAELTQLEVLIKIHLEKQQWSLIS